MSSVFMFGVSLAVMLFLQICGCVRQYMAIDREFQAIRKRNAVVAVGKSTFLGMNQTAVLGFDPEGFLREVHVLKGFTVFAKLKRISGLDGKHYTALREYCDGNRKMACVAQAVRYMEERYD